MKATAPKSSLESKYTTRVVLCDQLARASNPEEPPAQQHVKYHHKSNVCVLQQHPPTRTPGTGGANSPTAAAKINFRATAGLPKPEIHQCAFVPSPRDEPLLASPFSTARAVANTPAMATTAMPTMTPTHAPAVVRLGDDAMKLDE